MKVECAVEEVEINNEYGRAQPGVKVTCGRCDREEKSFGVTEKSINRCLILLKENCPMNESNYYVAE